MDTAAATPEGASPPASVERVRADEDRDTWRQLVRIALLFGFLSVLVTTVTVSNAPRLSVVDEATHVDYAWRAAHLGIPQTGEPLSEFTRDRWSCFDQPGSILPPCGSDAPPDAFPGDGLQYNAFHPPTYYVPTGLGARVMARSAGQDFITTARWLGAGWMFAAMLGMYLVLRSWRVDRVYAIAAGALLPVVPLLLHSSSTVTNDAPAALCGVGALYVLGRVVVHGQTGWVIPAVVAALAASTKVISAVALLTIAGIFLLMALQARLKRGDEKMPTAAVGAAIIAGVVAVHFGWELVQDLRQVPDYESPIRGLTTRKLDGMQINKWLPSVTALSVPGADYYIDSEVDSEYLRSWAHVLATVSLGAAFVSLVAFRRRTIGRLVGITVLVGVVAYPLLVQIQASTAGRYFPYVGSRYGMSLVPVAVAAATLVASHFRLRRLTIAMVVLGVVTVLGSSAGVV